MFSFSLVLKGVPALWATWAALRSHHLDPVPGPPGPVSPFCLNSIRAGLPVSLQLPFLQVLCPGGQSELVQPRGGRCVPAWCLQGPAAPRPMTSCAHVRSIFCFKLSTVACVFFPSGTFSSAVSLRCLFSFVSCLFRLCSRIPCLLTVSFSCPSPSPFVCISQTCLLCS